MNSSEIRRRFIDYFTKRGHIEVASSPLVPENHPTLLFTNSGMVQFTPYFLGEKDPLNDFGSKKLCSVQKSVRTGDIDIIGKSKYHVVFFEMLGSWSIGDYGKKEAVEFAFDLLTNKDYGYGLDPKRFIPTVFEGNEEAQKDEETINAWKSVGIEKISELPASENWWAPGPVGPCGPCTEILYDRGPEFGPEEKIPGLTDNPRYIEIWNAGVFMQFNRDNDGNLSPLPKMSVDTGAGLERFAVLLQGVDSVYETDLFLPIVQKIESMAQTDLKHNKLAINRSSEHIKSSSFIISEKVFPSNKDQGYVLRRLIRIIFNDFIWGLKIEPTRISEIIPIVFEMYKEIYPEIGKETDVISVFMTELELYKKVADNTKKVIRKNYKFVTKIDNPFDIYQSTGASRELIEALVHEEGKEVDFSDFDKRAKTHQDLSRKGMAQRFKGGLGDHSSQTIKYHTATHLLHKALREVLGDHVMQMGSNITPERLRFDFSHADKLTEDEKKKVENLVNEKIKESLPVNSVQMTKEDAEKSGALHFFKEKYGDKVTIYYIGNTLNDAWSKEYCGGPHVKNTLEIGKFKILKEESVGKGVRRIKAVVE